MRSTLDRDLQHKDILSKLHKSILKFLVPLKVEETYRIIAEETREVTGSSFCSVFIKDSGRLDRVYTTEEKLKQIRIRRGGYTWRASKSDMPAVVNIEKIEKFHPLIKDMGIKSIIYIPLIYKKEAIGVLSADSYYERKFSSPDLRLLKLFGSVATLAIRKSQLYDELEDALATRDLFISIASHELRTPLTTINSYAQLLNDSVIKRRKIQPKWTDLLMSEVTRLILMVNELLQVEQIKKGSLQYSWKEVDLLEIISRALVNFKAQFPDYNVVLTNYLEDGELKIMADFDKLLQAISNILGNAAKFSDQKDDIMMTIYYSSGNYIVRVEDRGAGIAERDLPRIFEGFYKGGYRHKKGLGLGLYLTKSIIEIHRGKIRVSSQPGRGTTVQLLIPSLPTLKTRIGESRSSQAPFF